MGVIQTGQSRASASLSSVSTTVQQSSYTRTTTTINGTTEIISRNSLASNR
jgi:hypothetical protein